MNSVIINTPFIARSEATKQSHSSSLRAQAKQSRETLNDAELYKLCREYGEKALEYRRKFMGLLPEVYRRELFKKKGFSSIFEFAAKLAGISKEQVSRVLNIEEKFRELPLLHEILVNGEVSVSKLAKVVSIATVENQEILATQVKLLPRTALETLARDYRIENQNGLLKPKNNSESVPGNTKIDKDANFSKREGFGKLASIDLFSQNQQAGFSEHSFSEKPAVASLNLSDEVINKLLELQNKGIDINQLILEFLGKRKEAIEEQKEAIGEEAQDNFIQYNITESRNVSTRIKKLFKQEHGTKCSMPRCNKPWSEIHHTQRFSLTKIHDPRYMAPLCREHHRIAHSIDQKYQEKRNG